MLPEFIFEWIALNPRQATTYLVAYCGCLSIAAWVGFYRERNKK